jgi:uncharacterized protein (TIGR02284 family)
MATTTYTTGQAMETLQALLRGELAAVETYQQALDKLGDDPKAADLRQVHQEHIQAANTIREQVRQFGGMPEHSSGAWGAFAKAVEGAAKLFGNTAAIKALKEGEEHGIKDYEKALQAGTLPVPSREAIEASLLPQTRRHLDVLDRLLS